MTNEPLVEDLTKEQATAELAELAAQLAAANAAYHRDDAPVMPDAEFDRLKRRNQAIEARFPDLKRSDSPTDQIGAPIAEAFAKVKHRQRMMSLANAFSDEDVRDFDESIRKFLGLTSDQSLGFVAEPKIDGLSLSLRYEDGKLVEAATRGDRGDRRKCNCQCFDHQRCGRET